MDLKIAVLQLSLIPDLVYIINKIVNRLLYDLVQNFEDDPAAFVDLFFCNC